MPIELVRLPTNGRDAKITSRYGRDRWIEAKGRIGACVPQLTPGRRGSPATRILMIPLATDDVHEAWRVVAF